MADDNTMGTEAGGKLCRWLTRAVGTTKYVGLFFLYWLAIGLAVSSFVFPILADEAGQPRLNHIPLVIWSLVTAIAVGVRSYRVSKSLEVSVTDGIVAGAIMYGGIALVSTVVKDMAQDVMAIRSDVFWSVIIAFEIALVSAGTMILIRRSIVSRQPNDNGVT